MIKQIRTSVEGEIRFEAEYDQGHGGWRDFQKESWVMIHPIANILFLMCDLTISPWTWDLVSKSLWQEIRYMHPYDSWSIMHGICHIPNCYFWRTFRGQKMIWRWFMKFFDKNNIRIQIFDRPTVWRMFDLCYDVINRCKLWKPSRTHSCLLIWPWREQRHHG